MLVEPSTNLMPFALLPLVNILPRMMRRIGDTRRFPLSEPMRRRDCRVRIMGILREGGQTDDAKQESE